MEIIAKQIAEELQQKMKSDGFNVTVSEQAIPKNNNVIKNALLIKPEDGIVAPTIYIDEYINAIKSGNASVEDVVVRIVDTYKQAKTLEINEAAAKIDFINAKEHLRCQVINYEANKELLKDIPHKKIEDLAIITRYKVDEDSSFIVKKDALEHMGMSASEAIEYGINNSIKDGFHVRSMADVMKEMMEPGSNMEMPSDMGLYVVSSANNVNGAAGIFVDRNLRAEIRDELGSDFYVLPSSIHECLVMKDTGNIDYESLQAMVREVNATQVAPEERLSDCVYHVDNSLRIKMCSAEADSQKVAEEMPHRHSMHM